MRAIIGLDRRDLLRGAAITAAAGAVAGCEMNPYALRDSGDGRAIVAALGPERWNALALAALAPSSHNVQPWSVRIIDRDHWAVGLDAARRLPEVDGGDREMILSLGMFVETLAIAAAAQRLGVAASVTGASRGDLVRLTLGEAAPSGLDPSLIRRRRTVRAGLLSDALSANDLAALREADADLMHLPMAAPAGQWLATATLAAFTGQSARDAAQRELADWIRWTPADVARHRTGLSPATMDLPWYVHLFVRLFFDKSSVMSARFRKQGNAQTAAQVHEGAAWLVLTSRDESAAELIACGRRAQQLWLRACALGIGLHPMSQVLEEAPWREQVSAALGIDRRVQMIFRAGRVRPYPAPVSARLSPAAFVRMA